MCADSHEGRDPSEPADGADAVDTVNLLNEVLERRYAATVDHFQAVMYREGSFRLAYAASRDMHSVTRFCIPVAAELAALHKPGWENPDSPLHRVVTAYSLCFTEKDDNWAAMLGAARVFFKTPDLEEAARVFLYCMGFVQLQYMLFMPFMAESMGEVWPTRAEAMLSGITRASLLNDTQRKELLQAMVGNGTLPVTGTLSTALREAAESLFYRQLQKLADTGEVSMEDDHAE